MNNIINIPLLSFRFPDGFEGVKGVCPLNSDNVCGKKCMKLISCEEYALTYAVCPISNDDNFNCDHCRNNKEMFYACNA